MSSEPGAPASPGGPDAGADTRDLSFLWPLVDRIRTIEVKFQGDDPTERTADLEARLTALEDAVAAIGRALHEAGGAATIARAAAAPPAEALVLSPQSGMRAACGAALAIALLLLAHGLVVFALDLPTLVLRIVSIAIPLPIGMWMTRRHRIRPWLEVAMAVSIGVGAVAGMSYVTAVREHASFLPGNAREWRETIEYVASIAFAYGTGVMVSAARQARSGASDRAGHLTLRLAEAIARVSGKVITTGAQIKPHVDLIHGLLNTAILLATGVMAIVTGFRSVLH